MKKSKLDADSRPRRIARDAVVLTVIAVIALAVFLVSSHYLSGSGFFQADEPTAASADDNKVGTVTNDKGENVTYAPKPGREFKNEKCDLTARPESSGNALAHTVNTWFIPSLSQKASFTTTGTGSEPITLPDAPNGVIIGSSPSLSDPKGATVEAGHVDYGPGQISAQGGELSPWGHLHKILPCEHIYQSDDKGTVHEFVTTSLYTVDQSKLPEEDEMWRNDGDKALFMVTCSGPAVGDDGAEANNRLLFNYQYNLVVKAVPAT